MGINIQHLMPVGNARQELDALVAMANFELRPIWLRLLPKNFFIIGGDARTAHECQATSNELEP